MTPFSWDDVPPAADGDGAVEVPIEDVLDLHTFNPRDVKPLLEEYLWQCQQRGFTEVRIVHGRGTGALRRTVQTWLSRNPQVADWRDAPPDRGGWGATIVRLKNQSG